MKKNLFLIIASAYSLLLCATILIGLFTGFFVSGAKSANAIDMPILAFLIALSCGTCGFGLYKGQNWSRFAFIILGPLGSLALASVFSTSLWPEDIPYTILAVFIYAPIVYTISRFKALQSFNVPEFSWKSRGGILSLLLVICLIVALFLVKASKKTDLTNYSFIAGLNYLGSFVKRLVVCQVLLWHYIGALIAITIPIKKVVELP